MSAISEIWRNAYVRVLVYCISIVILYFLAGQLSSVITIALLAYLFAYLFNPLVVWFERKRIPRGMGVAITACIVALFLALSSLLIGTVIAQLLEFSSKLPQLVQTMQNFLNKELTQLEQLRGQSNELKTLIDQITKVTQEGLSNLTSSVLKFLQGSGLGILSRTLGVVGNVLQAFLMLVIGFYMLSSFPQIGQTLLEILPRRFYNLAQDLSRDISTAVGGYIRGQLLIALGVGTMVGVGLAILGLPLAVTLGFLSAIFNVVPYLGVIISIAPALLIAAQFGLPHVIGVLIVFTVANQIEAHVLSPQILSKATDLHPVTVVLAILSGAALLGIPGALLAVPLAALGKLLVRKYWLGSKPHAEDGVMAELSTTETASDIQSGE